MKTNSNFVACADLLDRACPSREDVPFFNHCMAIAKELGMTWEQGLDYVIELRGQALVKANSGEQTSA